MQTADKKIGSEPQVPAPLEQGQAASTASNILRRLEREIAKDPRLPVSWVNRLSDSDFEALMNDLQRGFVNVAFPLIGHGVLVITDAGRAALAKATHS